jgi:HlyD family secretion protein
MMRANCERLFAARRPYMTARLLVAVAACVLVLPLAACNKDDNTYQGWIEAELIFVAPDEVGRVQTLSVREGDTVKTGELLFTVDDDLQQADLAQVKASLTNAQQTFDRASELAKSGTGTQKDLDAAVAVLRDAQARFNSSQTRLARRSVFSPVEGTVQQIYFRPGEMVPAARPVLTLLPPGNVKVRFFAPETILPNIAYGDAVRIGCDGCAANLTARVSFIARQSEFTPPVIYSLAERAKLVFLIEALPEKPGALRVGQPVDVTVPPQPAPPAQTPRPEASR